MNVKKTLLLVSALFLCAGAFAAGKIRIAPGASCYAWNINTKSKPDSIPAGGFVDESTAFYASNMYQCDELRNIHDACFILWEGYLRVPKTGQYRFTYAADARGKFGDRSNIKIFLNNSLLLQRHDRGETTVTAVANLKKGFVKFRIYYNPLRNLKGRGNGFSLKFAPASAMKMTAITPASLYHQVEDED